MAWLTKEEVQRGVDALLARKFQGVLKKDLVTVGIGGAIGFSLITLFGIYVWGWILLTQTMTIGCFLFLLSSFFASKDRLIVSRYILLLGLVLPSLIIGIAHPHSNLETPFFYRLPLFFCFVLSLLLFNSRNEKFHFWLVSLLLLIGQILGFYLLNPLLSSNEHDLLGKTNFFVSDSFVILGCGILLYIFLIFSSNFGKETFLEVVSQEWERNLQQQEALVQKEKELQQTVALLEEKEGHLREQIQAYDKLLADLNEREKQLKAMNETLKETNWNLQKMREKENRIRELESLLREHLNEPLRKLGHLFFHYLAKRDQLVVGALYYWDSETSQLCLGAVYGYSEERLPSTLSETNRNLLYEVFLLKEPIVISNQLDLKVELGVAEIHPQSLLLCPILHHDKVIGVMEMAFLNPLTEAERESILELCSHFATFCFTKIWT